jgi:DNA-binding HxlR family transcriptional regulator
VRDLLASPKTFSELRHGLPRISTDVLVARLRELEHAGVIQRLVPPGPQDPLRYELTEYGNELDEITLKLGRWGARLLGEPRPEEIVTTSSLIIAMRATFQQSAAAGLTVSYEIRMGEIVFHLLIDDGALKALPGPMPHADLRMEPGMALKGLMSGEISPADADENGIVYIGDPALLAKFAQLFRIVGAPSRD